jgi:hypothetical protein
MANSPAILLETPNRLLAPFSPFDPALANANMLFTPQTCGGKTFFVQMLLMMLARTNALISIIERGDSYRPLVELMGGRVIEVASSAWSFVSADPARCSEQCLRKRQPCPDASPGSSSCGFAGQSAFSASARTVLLRAAPGCVRMRLRFAFVHGAFARSWPSIEW